MLRVVAKQGALACETATAGAQIKEARGSHENAEGLHCSSTSKNEFEIEELNPSACDDCWS
jgi:hypothetical protein